jgi:Fe2+ or Zn2+ uptake regulation protein
MTNVRVLHDRQHLKSHPVKGRIEQTSLLQIVCNIIPEGIATGRLWVNVMNQTGISLLNQVTQKLRADGGRMTAQRRLILQVLESCDDHPTAEEIYERARQDDATLHLSTVYRTLRWLEEEGFVSPRWFEEDRRQERFDPVMDPEDHYHFRCHICNTIVEFPEPLIETIKAAYQIRFGGTVESATLTLYGVCQDCSSRRP